MRVRADGLAGAQRVCRLMIIEAAVLAIGAGPSQPRATIKGGGSDVIKVAFSPDNRFLALSCDNTVKLWRVEPALELFTLKGHHKDVHGLAFSPDSRTLATSSDDRTLRLWETASGRERAVFRFSESVDGVVFCENGKTLAVAFYRCVKLVSVLTGKVKMVFQGSHSSVISSIMFSPDGKTLATASWDKTVVLWEVSSGKALATLREHEDLVSCLAFSPDGKTLATACCDGGLRLWDVASRRSRAIVRVPGAGPVTAVAYARQGKLLVAGFADGCVRVWDAVMGKQLATARAHRKLILSLTVSADGRFVATGSDDGTAQLWELSEILGE